ncbi:MAG TPA: hypothetical protein VF251_05320 [Pyrinomonadaceae bacterium]
MREHTLMINTPEQIATQNSNTRTSTDVTRECVVPSWSNEELRNALAAIIHDRPVRIEVAGGIVRHHLY